MELKQSHLNGIWDILMLTATRLDAIIENELLAMKHLPWCLVVSDPSKGCRKKPN